MALITRISRIFKADFHAVLDQIEEPEMLLKQAIREMEDSLSETELLLNSARIEEEELKTRTTDLENTLGEIDEELDVCFESNEETLARSLIKRQLETQRFSKLVATKLIATEKNVCQQQKTLEDNRAVLESMRQKAELFNENSVKNSSRADISDSVWRPQELLVNDAEIEVAFLREKKRRVNP